MLWVVTARLFFLFAFLNHQQDPQFKLLEGKKHVPKVLGKSSP